MLLSVLFELHRMSIEMSELLIHLFKIVFKLPLVFEFPVEYIFILNPREFYSQIQLT